MTPLAWVLRVECPLCGAAADAHCGRYVAGEWAPYFRNGVQHEQRVTAAGLAMAADAAAGRMQAAREALAEQRDRERKPEQLDMFARPRRRLA